MPVGLNERRGNIGISFTSEILLIFSKVNFLFDFENNFNEIKIDTGQSASLLS